MWMLSALILSICKHKRNFPPLFHFLRWMQRIPKKMLKVYTYCANDEYFSVCCSCHYSRVQNLSILSTICISFFFFCVSRLMKSFAPMVENLLRYFSTLRSRELETIFPLHTLIWTWAILGNVNWSTISEWLDEIKVDVNDLIWNLQYCIEIWDFKILPRNIACKTNSNSVNVSDNFNFIKKIANIWISKRVKVYTKYSSWPQCRDLYCGLMMMMIVLERRHCTITNRLLAAQKIIFHSSFTLLNV